MVAHVAIPYKTAKNPTADGPKGKKTTKNWGVMGAGGAVYGQNFNIKQSVVFASAPGKRLLGGVAREASVWVFCQAWMMGRHCHVRAGRYCQGRGWQGCQKATDHNRQNMRQCARRRYKAG